MAKYTGSGRVIERGFLATHKSDFNAHVQGLDFKHNYFVFVGSSEGVDYLVGSATYPTFNSAMTAALADTRLTNGGNIFIKPGTYTITSTINIPNNINIIGEASKTVLVGETNETPMFKILSATYTTDIGGDSGSGIIKNFDGYINAVKFQDLILADNLNQTILDVLNHPKSTMATVPMIQCEYSSNFICESVKFLGRIDYGAVNGRLKTLCAIGYTAINSFGTKLFVNNCYFDGMQLAIDFNCNGGYLDYIDVLNCKARTYGTESNIGNNPDPALNCFVNINASNANLINNTYVGAGGYGAASANTFLNITSANNFNSSIKINISNNKGSGYYTGYFSEKQKLILRNNTSEVIQSVIAGNDWGNSTHNEWFIIVGNGEPSYTDGYSLGDFNGPNALDLLLLNNTTNCTIILNIGTYYVGAGTGAASNYHNVKLIGNKKGTEYPVVYVQSQSYVTDFIANKFVLFGNYLESIVFKSSISSTYNSVHIGFYGPQLESNNFLNYFGDGNALKCEVKDCQFIDCALVLDTVGGIVLESPIIGDCTVNVIDSHFKQTGSFSNNISIHLPTLSLINLENCTFNGSGYAGRIGSGAYSPGNFGDKINLKNCKFNVGYISNALDPSVYYLTNYFQINDSNASINIDNCKFDSVTSGIIQLIDTALINGPHSYEYSIFIKGYSVNIANSDFYGLVQTYIQNSTYDKIPVINLQIEPINTLYVNECKFVGGGLPLQVSADASDSTFSTDNSSIKIIDSIFTSDATDILTLLNIGIINGNFGTITLDNNYFYQNCQAYPYVVSSFCQSLINLNASNSDIFVQNNNIQGRSPNQYSLDGYYAVLNISNVVKNSFINNNKIKFINSHESNVADYFSTALYINGLFSCTNNSIFISNLGYDAGKASYSGCIFLDSYSSGIINNNLLYRESSNLRNGYIKLGSSTLGGIISENIFDHYTTNGSNENLIDLIFESNDLANGWVVRNNKNYINTYHIKNSDGNHLLFDHTLAYKILAFGTGSSNTNVAINSAIYGLGFDGIKFFYHSNDYPTKRIFNWILNLSKVIPDGSKILEISYDWATSNLSPSYQLVTLYVDGYADLPSPNTPVHDERALDIDMTSGSAGYTDFFVDGTNYLCINSKNQYILTIQVELKDSSDLYFYIENLKIKYIQ